MKTFFIKPAKPGIKVRDPVTLLHLSPDGEQKPRTNHWLRMVSRGEVVEAKENTTTETNKAVKSAADKKGGD